MNTKISLILGRGRLLAQKHSPEILLVAGLAGMVGATVLAVKATLKVEDIQRKNAKVLMDIDEVHASNNPEYSEEDYNHDLFVADVQGKLRFVQLYAPAALLGIAGMISIVGSHGIMQRRSASLMAAYAVLQTGFEKYRARVVEELGEEKDRDFKLGLRDEEYTEDEVNPETGRTKKVKKTRKVSSLDGLSQYARFFDEKTSHQYKHDPLMNKQLILSQQNYANEILRSRGYIFLNEIYNALGMDWTPEGQIVGWVLNGKNGGDGFVDLGLLDPVNDVANHGLDTVYIIDPNVDGVVVDLI